MSADKPTRSLPATARDTLRRAGMDRDVIEADVCPLCSALIDPDGSVLHREFHDGLLPVRPIGDQP